MKKSTKLYQKGKIGSLVALICEKYNLDQQQVVAYLIKNTPELKDKSRCKQSTYSIRT